MSPRLLPEFVRDIAGCSLITRAFHPQSEPSFELLRQAPRCKESQVGRVRAYMVKSQNASPQHFDFLHASARTHRWCLAQALGPLCGGIDSDRSLPLVAEAPTLDGALAENSYSEKIFHSFSMFIFTNENRALDVATGTATRRVPVTAQPPALVECLFRSRIGIRRINKTMARCAVRERRVALCESGQALLML